MANLIERLQSKAAEFFRPFFDASFSSRPTFFPVGGGHGKAPVNLARSDSGNYITPYNSLKLSAVWACTWLIADTLSTLPIILNQRDPKGRFGSPATDDTLYQILATKPNAEMSPSEFWEMMIASQLSWGNGYALKDRNGRGDVISLVPMRPEFVVPYRDEDKQIRYRYDEPGGTQDYAADEVFHLKDRTLDGLAGVSRIEYAANSYGIATSAERASSDSFKNGLRAAGFLKAAAFLKKEQRETIRESLTEFAQGGDRAGQLMVLEGGLDFTALSLKPQDIELLASRQYAVEDICRWFGVPPVLVGHASSGQTMWGTGIEQILLGWLSLNLRPMIRRIEQSANRQLIRPANQLKQYIRLDTDDLTAADSAARAALYSQYAQNGILTRNEIRDREDLEPIDGGNDLTVQSNLVPIAQLGSAGTQQAGQVRAAVRSFLGIDDAQQSAKDGES